MPASIRHRFVCQKIDGTDSSLVRPVDWNAEHVIEGIGNRSVNTVESVPAPAFDCSMGDVQYCVVSEDVAPIISNLVPGQSVTFVIAQPGGPFTITWPGNVSGGKSLALDNSTLVQEFVSVDGINLLAFSA